MRIYPCFVENREKIPVMMETNIRGQLEKFIKWDFKKLNLLTTIRCNRCYLHDVTSYKIVRISHHIARTIISEPRLQILYTISSFFEEFSSGTFYWIFIWSIKCTTRKRNKSLARRLFLEGKKYISIWKNRYHKCTIEKTNSLEPSNTPIIHILIPLIYLRTHSREYTFRILRNIMVMEKFSLHRRRNYCGARRI